MLRSVFVGVAGAIVIAPAAHADFVAFHDFGDRYQIWVGFDTPVADSRAELLRGGTVVGEGGSILEGRQVLLSNVHPAAGDVLHVYRDGALYGSMTFSGGPQVTGACAGREHFTAVADPGHRIRDVHVESFGPNGRENASHWTKSRNPARVEVDWPLFLGEQISVDSKTETFWPTGAAAPLSIAIHNEFDVASVCPRPVLRSLARALGRRDRAQLVRSRSIVLPLDAVAPGTTRVRLTRRHRGRTITLGTGSRTRTDVGRVKLAVRLTSAGRAALRSRAQVRVRFAASFTPPAGRATRMTATVTLK